MLLMTRFGHGTNRFWRPHLTSPHGGEESAPGYGISLAYRAQIEIDHPVDSP